MSWTKKLWLSLAVVVAIAVSSAIFAQDGSMSKPTDAQVIDMQKQFQAACVAADGATLGRLMSDEAIFIHGNAAVQSKSEFIAAITGGQLGVSQYDIHDPKVILFQGGAIVSGLVDFGIKPPAGSQNPPRVLHMRGSAVWIQTSAGWRLLLDQDTSVPAGAPPPASH